MVYKCNGAQIPQIIKEIELLEKENFDLKHNLDDSVIISLFYLMASFSC